jgi:hypothetical protein
MMARRLSILRLRNCITVAKPTGGAFEPIAHNHFLIFSSISLIDAQIFPVNVFREISCKSLFLFYKYRSETRTAARNA